MSGTISLTPEENHDLTTALRLEAAGFHEAARWLRSHILSLRLLDWDDPAPKRNPEEIAQWIELFRAHRGSVPPHQWPAPPTLIQPSIRPDQTIAQTP